MKLARIIRSLKISLGILLIHGTAQAASFSWDAGGANPLWSTGTNWVGDAVPTFAASDTFALTHPIVASGTSTVDFSSTLGIINIIGSANGAATWTLTRSASEVLTLDNGASAAQINTLLTNAGGGPANTIDVAIATTGNLNINNQANAKTLAFTRNISSVATSGTQTITLTGNVGFGSFTDIRGGISDGSAGGKIAVDVNSANATFFFDTTSGSNTYTGGTTLRAGVVRVRGNAFGANGSSLTISGSNDRVFLGNGAPFSATSQNLGTLNIFTNFLMDAGNTGQIFLTGSTAVNLNSATRTISGQLGANVVNANVLVFNGSGQTINDGTLRILGTNGASLTAPTSLGFNVAVTFNNANLEIGANATTTFGVNNAFGTNPANLPNVTVQTGGALNLSQGAYGSNLGRSLTIGSLSGSGRVTNSADAASTAVLTINGTNSTTFSGTIQDGGYNGMTLGRVALTKEGSSTLTLSGNNIYTGTTTVNAGTLLINGSIAAGSTVSVGAAGTLSGTGTIGGTTTVAGTLSPGNSPGILTVNNNVTITNGGAFAVEVNGTVAGSGYDQLNVTGGSPTFSLTGTNNLVLSLGYTPIAVANFFIATISGTNAISGVFESLNGSVTNLTQDSIFSFGGYNWQISYTGDVGSNTFSGAGNDLALQVVPEPSAWLLLAFSSVLVIVFRRRRRTGCSAGQ